MNKNRSNSARRSKIPGVNKLRSSSSNRNDVRPSISNQQRLSRISSVSSTLTRSAKDHKVTMKDPRPITDKSYLLGVVKELIEFLASYGYNNAVSQKMLQSPSNSDFRNIVNFMVTFLPIGGDSQLGTNFEESFPDLMVKLSYPMPIPKRLLKTVGVPHQWPFLLLTLDYIKNLIVATNNSTDVQSYLNPKEQKLYNCLGNSYRSFLQGQDYSISSAEEFRQNFIENPGLKQQNDEMEEELIRLIEDEALMKIELEKNVKLLRDKEGALVKMGEQKDTCMKKRFQIEELLVKKNAELPILAQKHKIMEEKENELMKELEAKQEIIKTQESLGFDVYKLSSDIQIKEGENKEIEARINTGREDMYALNSSLGDQYKQIRDRVDDITRELWKLDLSSEEGFVFDLKLDPKNMDQFKADFIQLKDLLNSVRSKAMQTKSELETNIKATDEQYIQSEKDKLVLNDQITDVERKLQNLAMLEQNLQTIHDGKMVNEKEKVRVFVSQLEGLRNNKYECISRNNLAKKNLAALKNTTLELLQECKRFLGETKKSSKTHLSSLQNMQDHYSDLYKKCMKHSMAQIDAMIGEHKRGGGGADGENAENEDKENKD